MHPIISTELVRTRLALRDDEGVNLAVTSAIQAAVVRVGALLLTGFDYGAGSDLFYAESGKVVPGRGNLLTFRTKNGFLRQLPLVRVYAASSLDAVLTTSSGEVRPVLFDAERGHVKIPVESVGPYFRVDYEYGFKPDEEAPAWLQEVVLGNAVRFLFSQQISDGQAKLTEVMTFLEKTGCEILDRHLRTSTDTLVPLV